jgi:IclR helix-turn-helix domain
MSATDKLLAIFALFTEEAPEWTVEGAASHLGIATSTAYRLFKSLTDAGLIVAFASGRYVLGPAVIQLDRQIRLQDPLIRAAETTMKRLASESAVPGIDDGHQGILLSRSLLNVFSPGAEKSRENAFIAPKTRFTLFRIPWRNRETFGWQRRAAYDPTSPHHGNDWPGRISSTMI